MKADWADRWRGDGGYFDDLEWFTGITVFKDWGSDEPYFDWRGWRVTITSYVNDPASDLPLCGEKVNEACYICLLPPGHETPHLPCSYELWRTGLRIESFAMAHA